MKFILGKKIEMSQVFDEKGKVIPVTLIEAGPCYVTQIKTEAVQIGFEKLKDKKVKKPQKDRPYRYLREFSIFNSQFSIGDKIDVSIFGEGDKVKISGISKGKGFASTRKRWHFKGGQKSHGQKDKYRSPGSIGSSSYPSRVLPGLKMAGRMGSEKVTVKNMKVASVDSVNNKLYLAGPAPGSRGGLLVIKKIK